MADFTSLVYGFPVTGDHAFTRTAEGTSHAVDGAVEDWREIVGKALGLEPVARPTEDQEGWYDDDGWHYFADEVLAEVNRPHDEYCRQLQQLLETFGGVTLDAAGSDDTPEFFLQVYLPKIGHGTFVAVPDLTAVPPESLAQARRLCQLLGIEYQEPAWHLVRSWYLD